MSKYTVQLREVIEVFGRDEVESWFKDYDLHDYLTDDEIAVIEKRGTWSKDKLARKIVNHYMMNEIGQETPQLFEMYAKIAMSEIMEAKLPLIYSAAIEYDPLVNVDFSETFSGTNSGSAYGTNTSASQGITMDSDTPQGKVSKSSILAGEYVSSTSGNENNSTNASQNSSEENQEYTKRTKGNSGISTTAQKLIQQYRENIIMIDRDIIKDLGSLFMSIY